MNKVKLSSIIDIISGGTPKTDVKSYWDSGTIGWLSVTDFNNDLRYVYSTEKQITEEGLKNSNTKLLNKGDIIISARGTVGALAQIGAPMCFNQSCFGLRGKMGVVETDFLYYALKNYVHNIKKRSQGSVFYTINLNSFDLMEIEIPKDLATQKKIATVLSALDAKIELNNQINAELEKMAKTIYDYWFVQFDFPDANGKPYKSSGGKMVWNEELKREIPAGWEVLQLSNKLTFEKGIEPGSAQYKEKKESINHIKFIRVGDIENYSSIFVDNSQKKYATVNEKNVLVTFDGSVGKVAFGFEGAYSGGLRKIYDKSGLIDSSLIYFIFKDERLIKTIHKYATGSILLHAGASINILKISFSEKKYLEFQNIIKPFFYKMMINKKQNQTLADLRDWLLPMLMNGQIKVE